MNSHLDQIVKAVLYEGYILYPYRATSPKNQRERFTFGRVYPQRYSEDQHGAEACVLQTERLWQRKGPRPAVNVTLGFLQPMQRQIGVLKQALSALPEDGGLDYRAVPRVEINGQLFHTWAEAVERSLPVAMPHLPAAMVFPFSFPASEGREPILNENGNVAGVIIRRQELLEGRIEIKAVPLGPDLYKVCARVVNLSPVDTSDLESAERVLHRTFASTHFVLETTDGEFISLLDPPAEFKPFAGECRNIGCWPVLVGEESVQERRAILASPIILYDYPRISPQSTGDFFDGTEIDEMLTLRVLTLTDSEKAEMRTDAFARQVLERATNLGPADLLNLHGQVQPTDLATEQFFNPANQRKLVVIDGVELKAGDLVAIRPRRRADAMDLMLAGKTAVIETVEEDAEGNIHLALVLEDDPGRELGLARQSGHRFFFGVDEVEPVQKGASA